MSLVAGDDHRKSANGRHSRSDEVGVLQERGVGVCSQSREHDLHALTSSQLNWRHEVTVSGAQDNDPKERLKAAFARYREEVKK